jgi:coenzyme F420-0:L-glutamate ligase / coenzyme F420-1:gamma-L-glutamate ligase
MNGRNTSVIIPSSTAVFRALAGVPLVKPGDDLTAIIVAAVASSEEKLRDGDVLVIAQKIVSKAQNRFVQLKTVLPSPRAEQVGAPGK